MSTPRTGQFNDGGTFDSGLVYGPGPANAVVPHCLICGNATFCGGPQCPSATLPLAPDGVPANSQVYEKVTVFNFVSGALIDQVA